MTKPLREENGNSRGLDEALKRGDNYVARFIGGAALGAFAVGVATAGGGVMPGAVAGGLIAVVAPGVVSGIQRAHHNA